MYQYVFIHIDATGSHWRHIHFSRIIAEQERKWWAGRKTTTVCSIRITELKRKVRTPRIVGINVDSTIELEESNEAVRFRRRS